MSNIRLEGLDGPESVGVVVSTEPVQLNLGVFDEKTLEAEIHRVWGPAGAHADVFYEICKRAGINL